jgi:hypothetical protein
VVFVVGEGECCLATEFQVDLIVDMEMFCSLVSVTFLMGGAGKIRG